MGIGGIRAALLFYFDQGVAKVFFFVINNLHDHVGPNLTAGQTARGNQRIMSGPGIPAQGEQLPCGEHDGGYMAGGIAVSVQQDEATDG